MHLRFGLCPPPVNLHDMEAVRREMVRVYRDMRSMKIDGSDGSRLVHALSQIVKLIEASSFERRLEALEHNPSRRLAQPDDMDVVEVIVDGQESAYPAGRAGELRRGSA